MHVTIRRMEQQIKHVLHGSILSQMSSLHLHVIRGQQKIFRIILIIYLPKNVPIVYQTVQALYMKRENQLRHL